MWAELVLLLAGLVLLIGGGSALVRGASDIARRLGIAPVIVGMTVVAFGTSTPELVVNLAAALRGNSEIGFGNVVGSNIANIGLLLAFTAVLAPLAIHRTIVIREIPMMILACAAALVLGGGGLIGNDVFGYGRGDGIMLLLLFLVFLYYTIGDALRQRHDAFLEGAASATGARSDAAETGALKLALLVGGGLLLLVAGGEFTVRGATGMARSLGVAETLVGLTVVAVGTSLPELSTSVIAARNGQSDVAIGNIVGSNIYNMLFIWGLSVTIAPSALPAGGLVDLLVMTGFALVLLPMVVSQNRLGRLEGGLMLLGYAGYVAWLFMRG